MSETTENEAVTESVEPVNLRDLKLLLQQSLQQSKQLSVLEYSVRRLVPPGENYSSTLIKLDATIRRNEDGPEEELHLVGKMKNRTEKPIMEWATIFRRELFVYDRLIPTYRELERELGIEESHLIDITPGYIGHRNALKENSDDVDEDSVLLLENIKVKGYHNCDRRTGLDVDHAILALKSLARYHALGMAMKQKRPEFAEIAIGMAELPQMDFQSLSEVYKKNFNVIREIAGFEKHTTAIEASYVPFLNGNVLLPEAKEPWATINHGDFWVNNIMFHEDEVTGKVDRVKFLDFQMYLHTSALTDLPYFFCGALDDAAVADHFVDLLDIYYRAFVESLDRLDCDITAYTKEAFDAELKKQAFSMFPICALSMKFFAFESEERETTNNSELITSIFNDRASDAYIHRLQRLIKIYEDRNWF